MLVEPCLSSLDEIDHLERVIELHRAKYSVRAPFVIPPPPSEEPSLAPPVPQSLDAPDSTCVDSHNAPVVDPIPVYSTPSSPYSTSSAEDDSEDDANKVRTFNLFKK